MCFIDEDVDVVAGVGVFLDTLELMDHGDDEASPVALQQVAKTRARFGTPNRDVLLLHLAEQSVHPTAQLSLEFGTVHNNDYCGSAELRLTLQNETCRREKRERLSRPLGVPDQPALLVRL